MDLKRSAASDIRDDEVVVFFPTSAYLDRDERTWIVPIHGVVYEPERESIRRNAFAVAIHKMLRVESGTPEAKILDERLRYFLVDHEQRKRIVVGIGSEHFEMNPSDANGHFLGEVRLADAALQSAVDSPSGSLTVRAVMREGDERNLTGLAQVIGPRGFSIISDIDDTIKHTQAGDRNAVLANTFLRPFQPVPGMPELYRECAGRALRFTTCPEVHGSCICRWPNSCRRQGCLRALFI